MLPVSLVGTGADWNESWRGSVYVRKKEKESEMHDARQTEQAMTGCAVLVARLRRSETRSPEASSRDCASMINGPVIGVCDKQHGY